MIPPERKMVDDSTTARPLVASRTRPSRAKRKAITTVAKTSKKPSTTRCTNHHRPYSVLAGASRPLVETGDGDRRDEEESQDAALHVLAAQRGPDAKRHQEEPEEEA